MQHYLNTVLALVIALFATTANAAGNEYECTVDDIVTFGDDDDFVAKNMRKQYLITLDVDQVYITMLSDEFSNSQRIYTIINRTMMDVYAVSLSPASISTVALSSFYFENNYNTTLSRQSTFGATVWKLDCEKS